MQVQPLCTLSPTAKRLFYVWICVQQPFLNNITISPCHHPKNTGLYSELKSGLQNGDVAAKQSAVNPTHGAGSQLEGGDIPQKTMEIFWRKITTILRGSYWRGQVESGIRRESLCACNNKESDGSDSEQLEQICPFSYPKFIALLDLLLYFYVSHLGLGIWVGMVRHVFHHGTWSWKNHHREALIPASPLGLCFVSPGKLVQTVLGKHLCCVRFKWEALQACLWGEAPPLPKSIIS